MSSSGLQEAQALAAGIMRDMRGQAINFSTDIVAVAVYPAQQSGGLQASQVVLYGGGAYFRAGTDNRPGTDIVAADPSAYLIPGVTYVMPLHPAVNTLYFLHPTGASMQINWVLS